TIKNPRCKMNMINILKKPFFLLIAILSAAIMIFISFTGCNALNDSGIGDKTVNDKSGQNSQGKSSSSINEDFPSELPVYPGAELLESVKEESGQTITYKIRMQSKGEIEKLSEWYKKALEEKWSVGSISEGDMGDWSEFFAEAQNENNMLTVYLYQDKNSDIVSIDLDVSSVSASGQEIAESSTYTEIKETAREQSQDMAEEQSYSGELENAKIAFVCASVGSAWNIGEHFLQLDISVYDEYQFDKGCRIQEILDSDRPDIMIIKECAAYFPPQSQGSSMQAYQDLIRDWVNFCRGQAVIPVLTTVVPIDPNNPSNAQQQLDSILQYNDWIRQYCQSEKISVLDLEQAVRVSDSDRSLDPAYDSGDGLHLNESAYSEKLDNILIPALEKALEFGN
ncbi:MAG: SGNH/GDSL hydrolase family protein, partial [Actinobacteria bacterium]|nr:SGNH/GDSL hydrolase family protein [Actinomycetota bacterium]